jgi:alcohol dehydrogenase
MKQQEIVQQGAISKLIKLLEDYQNVKIFLIHGKQSYIKSGAHKIISNILTSYNFIEFEKSSSIPNLEEAERGYQLFENNKCNLIMSIGGGSVIDTGKLIKYKIISGQSADIGYKTIPLIAIPTTAGSGSEATHFAVVYIDGIKQSIASNELLPDVAIVDSNLIFGQSKYQLAVSGMDAFAQGLESYWSINSTNESMEYSEKAIGLIWANLENAVNGDFKAYRKLAEGSFYAGKAINITKTSAPHALSYGFTSLLGIPHGHAVSLFLPFFTQYHASLEAHNCVEKRGPKFVKEKINSIASFLNANIDQVDLVIARFISSLGLEISFNQLNISSKRFHEIVKDVNIERLKNNPGIVNNDVFSKIYNYNNINLKSI